ncbi:MAG: hypothetical protein FWG02_11435 [Holophagaceae bacterium]|nr:hypothetical protein [Holophagaceae bacterium]
MTKLKNFFCGFMITAIVGMFTPNLMAYIHEDPWPPQMCETIINVPAPSYLGEDYYFSCILMMDFYWDPGEPSFGAGGMYEILTDNCWYVCSLWKHGVPPS